MYDQRSPENQFLFLKRVLQNCLLILFLFLGYHLSSQNAGILIEAEYRPISKTIIPVVSTANMNNNNSDFRINVSIGEYSIDGLSANPSNSELKKIADHYKPAHPNSKNQLLAQSLEKNSYNIVYSDKQNVQGGTSDELSFRPFSGDPGRFFFLQVELINASSTISESNKAQVLFFIPKKNKIHYPETLLFRARGTGRTTGHIITLSITNSGNKPVITEIGPSIVPCSKEDKENIARQGFFTYETYPISLGPGESIEIPIQGYCIHNDKPAPGPADPVPAFEVWITPQDVGFIPDPTVAFPSETPFERNKDYTSEEIQLVYPGTDVPFPYQIDLDNYLLEAAPMIFFTGEALLDAVDEEINNGTLITPISSDPVKLKETVVQHDMWLVTSALDSDEENNYGFEEFSSKTKNKLEQTAGQSFASLPKETQEDVDEGIVDLFSGFTLVGAKAKVLKKNKNVQSKGSTN